MLSFLRRCARTLAASRAFLRAHQAGPEKLREAAKAIRGEGQGKGS